MGVVSCDEPDQQKCRGSSRPKHQPFASASMRRWRITAPIVDVDDGSDGRGPLERFNTIANSQ